MKRNMLALAAVSVVALLTAPVAKADVIFSTDGTATPGFYPDNGGTSTTSIFHAFQFTVGAGAGGVVAQLAIGLLSYSAFTDSVKLLSDSSGQLGSVLDTFTVAVTGDGNGHLYTASSTTDVTLVSGATYWLEVASPSVGEGVIWLEADPIVEAREYSSATGYFDDQPVFTFALLTESQQPVPEPATFSLAGIGIAGLWLARRRRASAMAH